MGASRPGRSAGSICPSPSIFTMIPSPCASAWAKPRAMAPPTPALAGLRNTVTRRSHTPAATAAVSSLLPSSTTVTASTKSGRLRSTAATCGATLYAGMTTCTRVSRNTGALRSARTEEHGAGPRIGAAGQALRGGQHEGWQHEERPRRAAREERHAARLPIGPRSRRAGQERERDVAGVLPEWGRRPANVCEACPLEQPHRARGRRDRHVPRRLGHRGPARAEPPCLPAVHHGESQDHPAARLEELVNAGQRGRGVWNVLEHIHHDHRVVATGLERQRLERPGVDGEPDPFARVPDIRGGCLRALDGVTGIAEMTEEEAAAAARLQHEAVLEAGQPANEGYAPAIARLVEAPPLDGPQQAPESRAARLRLERVVARGERHQALGRWQRIQGGRPARPGLQEAMDGPVDAVVVADPLVERREGRGTAEEAGHQSFRASSRRLSRWVRRSRASSWRLIVLVARMARRRRHMAGPRTRAAHHARTMMAARAQGDCRAASLPAAPRPLMAA